MWSGLLNSIRQIGVFMICAQALIYFKPNGSYEKYLKLLVGAMILVQLLSPVAALLSGKGGWNLEERIGFYSDSFEQGMGEAALQEYRVEQIRQQLLTTQIRAQMEAWGLQPQQDTHQTAGEAWGLQPQQDTPQAAGEAWELQPQQDTPQAAGGEWQSQTQQEGWWPVTEQDLPEEAGDIRIQIDPVTIGASWSGQQDVGQREEGHGGEDQERDDKMAEEG